MDRDTINGHSLELSQIKQQLAALPVRLGDSNSETFRLIRGQAVGAVGSVDSTFLIDNVVVLAGGLDPSGGNPATQVRIANGFGQTYGNDEWVQAVYSPGVVASPTTDWETLKSAGSVGDLPIIYIRNLTGLTMLTGSIFGIGAVLPESFASLHPQPTFDSKPPVANESFAVSLEDALPNAIVKCLQVAGVWTQINLTNASHRFADCVNNNYTFLNSGTQGRGEISWRERQSILGAGTLGQQWAWVLLDRGGGGGESQQGEMILARVLETITPATDNLAVNWGIGTVQLQSSAGSLIPPPDGVITVKNPWIGLEFVANTQVKLETMGGVAVVAGAACNPVSNWV